MSWLSYYYGCSCDGSGGKQFGFGYRRIAHRDSEGRGAGVGPSVQPFPGPDTLIPSPHVSGSETSDISTIAVHDAGILCVQISTLAYVINHRRAVRTVWITLCPSCLQATSGTLHLIPVPRQRVEGCTPTGSTRDTRLEGPIRFGAVWQARYFDGVEGDGAVNVRVER